MCAGKHGDLFPVFSQHSDLAVQVQEKRKVFEFKRVFPGKRDGGIINILGG
jgi:hypothetical protein